MMESVDRSTSSTTSLLSSTSTTVDSGRGPDLGGVTLGKLIDFSQGRAPVPIPADGVGVVRDHPATPTQLLELCRSLRGRLGRLPTVTTPSAGNGTASRILSTSAPRRTARRAQHSARCAAGQASAQSTPRRHTCRKPFQPRTRSTLQHAPAASSLTSIIAHCTCTYDQAHKLDTRLGRYYLPGTYWHAPQCTPAGSTPTSSTTLQHSESAGTAQAADSATRARALACWRAC